MLCLIRCFLMLLVYQASVTKPGNIVQQGVKPTFEGSETTNLTAHVGATALLACKIRNNLENNPVSWIRLRDWNILTIDQNTFTNDARFMVLHKPKSSDWTLAIKYVSIKDEGVYVCQISTRTGSVSHYYNLHIVVPRAYILGSEEYFAKSGGDISLVCIIEDTLEPPQYVYWYHNDKILNYDTRRTRVSFDQGGENSKKTSSRLVIADVQRSDSGNYTCTTDSALPSLIVVYVSDDMTQPLQKESSAKVLFSSAQLITLLILSLK